MGFFDFINQPISKKNVLVEIDTGQPYDTTKFWPYMPTVFWWKLNDFRQNASFDFGTGGFGYGS